MSTNRATTILDRAPPPMFTTPAAVREAVPLGVLAALSDAQLVRLIAAASRSIVADCGGREFGQQRVRDTFHAYGAPLVLSCDLLDPATADMTVMAGDTLLDRASWQLDPAAGLLVVMGGHGTVQATYVSGWTFPGGTEFPTLPAAIEGACIDRVAIQLWRAGRDPGIKSETVPGVGSLTYRAAVDTADARLLPFIVPAWG